MFSYENNKHKYEPEPKSKKLASWIAAAALSYSAMSSRPPKLSPCVLA